MSFPNQRCQIYANPYEIGPSNTSQGQHRRKDATEQIINLTLARSRTKVPGFSSADAVTAMPRVPVAGPEFYPYKLSDLKFTPLPSLHVDFYSRHVVNSVLFLLHNCPLLIPLHNTAVLIKICRF